MSLSKRLARTCATATSFSLFLFLPIIRYDKPRLNRMPSVEWCDTPPRPAGTSMSTEGFRPPWL